MGKQKIEVVIDCPDEMMLQELMEKVITDIVVDRINRLYGDNSALVIEKLIKDRKYKRK